MLGVGSGTESVPSPPPRGHQRCSVHHHLNPASHRLDRMPRAAPERRPLPTPCKSRTAGALTRRRASVCGASTAAGLAVVTEGKWAKRSAARRRRRRRWKELCHARHRAVVRQVSPSVTQLFRAFLGSCHITRLMSTLRFVINSPARLHGDRGATLVAQTIERDCPVPSQRGKQMHPARRASRSALPCFQENGSHGSHCCQSSESLPQI